MIADSPGVRRAWGWVDHLRSGGTTPWSEWSGQAVAAGPVLPGAQHLEVVRRLNLLGPVPAHLTDTVLSTSGAGRGQQDLDLVGVRDGEHFGAPAVDPAHIAAEELSRVGAGALADLVLAAPAPAEQDRASAPRRRLRRHRYRLVGDPLLAGSYRDQLSAQGRPSGGRHPRVVLLLHDYAGYLADVWSVQARRGNGLGWGGWLDQFAGQRVLPHRVDVVAVAAQWADRVGPDRVHPAFEPHEVAAVTGGAVVTPDRLSHAALEVARETSTALRLSLGDEARQARLAGVLLPWLRAVDTGTLRPPTVPERHRDWVQAEAVRIRDALADAGYPVPRGGLDRLLPDQAEPRAGVIGSPDDGEVLGMMVAALHHGAAR
ncbi:hypothetical protein [Nocardioides sp.]|uniref:hypothetical protein n=1 Tax=Nocardioides sp. TaxID=35761 RepID=UPI003D130D0D